MSQFGEIMNRQRILNPRLFAPNYDDWTRVLGPVSKTRFGVLHENANEKGIPQKIYGMPNSYSSYRNYDEMRDCAISGDENAIKTLTNLALQL